MMDMMVERKIVRRMKQKNTKLNKNEKQEENYNDILLDLEVR
jgi:hypothetical protein